MVYVLHGVASAISQQLSGATAVRMWDHVFNNNANSVIAQAFLVTGVVGILCLAVGLFRSHAVPHTAAVLTGLGAALLMVTAAGPVKPLIVGAAALAFIGFGWVAIAASGGRASVRHRQGTESNRAG